jgi:FtsH-binding integral membrane protein
MDEIIAEILDDKAHAAGDATHSRKHIRISRQQHQKNIISVAMVGGLLGLLFAEIEPGGISAPVGFFVGFGTILAAIGLLSLVALTVDARSAARKRAEALQILTLLALSAQRQDEQKDSAYSSATTTAALAAIISSFTATGFNAQLARRLMELAR